MAGFIKNYEILQELGAGQYGRVYMCVGEVPGRGIHPAKRRTVAIKKLREPNAESVRLLLQEFALLDQVKHRGVVRVFEYLDAEHAVVMELVRGATLRTVLATCAARREQVFTEAALEIGCEIADALYQAYTTPGDNSEPLQLVHRDLKPENIILTPAGEVKLLDFGLARVDNADFERDDPHRIKGTPVYMAPEQARGEDVDHRTDLFALGLILYELLMGRPAYRVPADAADPHAAVMAAIEGGELSEQIRELEVKLPGMGPIVARLLQARPRNRYQHGHDLLVDLRRQLYKDRGAYLTEFCDFFYGSLYKLPHLPDADIGTGPGAARPSGATGGPPMSTDKGRKSMEDRLREQEEADAAPPATPARDPGAPRAAVPVRRAPAPPPPAPAAIAPSPEPRAAAPRSVPAAPPRSVPVAPRSVPLAPQRAADPPGPPAGRAPMPPAGRPPTPVAGRPPTPVARLAPVAPDEDSGPPSVKGGRPNAARAPALPRRTVGARSPDETGMLRMVPLSDNEDEKDAGADPSATSFFALPAPKSERPKSVAPAPPPSSGPAPAGPSRAPFTPPQYAPTPIASAGGPGQQGPLVSGPVVSYGGAAGGTPFQVGGPQPTANTNEGSRVQSIRVYAIVLGVFALACVAVLSVVALWFFKPGIPVAVEKPDVVADNSDRKPPRPREDTGVKQAKVEAPAPTRVPRPSTGPRPVAPPKLGATASMTVTFTGSPAPTLAKVVCSSDFVTTQLALAGGSATFANVPTSGICQVHPKGGPVATPFPVRGGKSYTCSITGTTTNCK